MTYTIRPYQAGELSLIAHFYYKLYEKDYGFLPETEGYFMDAIKAVLDSSEGSQAWVVEEEGEIKGSIAIVKRNEHTAQLRMFAVDRSLQGQGLGKRLMTIAMDFCQKQGYDTVNLWTIEMLSSARHLYAQFGFHITANTKLNTSWATYPMIEEEWIYKKD